MPSYLRKLGGAPHWSKGEDPAFVDRVKAIRPLIDNFKEIVKLLKKYHVTFRESVTTYGAKCSTQLVGLQSLDAGWEHLSRLGELFGSECNVLQESIDGATGQGLLIPLESFLNTELHQAHAMKTRFRQDKLTHYQKKAAHEKANRKEPGGVKANQASTEESIAENELKKSRAELEKQLEELERGRVRFAKVVTDYTDLRLASLEKSIQTLAETRAKIKAITRTLPDVEDKPPPPRLSPMPAARKEVQHVPPTKVASKPLQFFNGESDQLDRLPKPNTSMLPPGMTDDEDDDSEAPDSPAAGATPGGPPPPPMAATNPGAAAAAVAARLPPPVPTSIRAQTRPPTAKKAGGSGLPFPSRTTINGTVSAGSSPRTSRRALISSGRVQTSFTPPLKTRKPIGGGADSDSPRRSSTSALRSDFGRRTSSDVVAAGPPGRSPPRASATMGGRSGTPPPLLSQVLTSSRLGAPQSLNASSGGPRSLPRPRTNSRPKTVPRATGGIGGPPPTSSTGARGSPPNGPREPRGSAPVTSIGGRSPLFSAAARRASTNGIRGPPPVPAITALNLSRGGSPPSPNLASRKIPPPVPAITALNAARRASTNGIRGPPPVPAITALNPSRGGPPPSPGVGSRVPPPVPAITALNPSRGSPNLTSRGPPPVPAITALNASRGPPPPSGLGSRVPPPVPAITALNVSRGSTMTGPRPPPPAYLSS